MSSTGQPYHEALLHWIWDNRHFSPQHSLATTDGQKVIVHDTGKHNHSDGPDFLSAEITIGNLRWFGDIELHWQSSDWRSHGHFNDPNFQQVILHVVFDGRGTAAKRSNGSVIPTLNLSSYVDKPLKEFLSQYRKQSELPCSGQLSFISKEAFRQQLDKAHKEYFEQKVDDLYQYYDPNLGLSAAWQKMLGMALFDGLGISHNRRPMRKLAKELFHIIEDCVTVEDLKTRALEISGIEKASGGKNSAFIWKHRGVRPGNHPKPRILQGAHCLWHISHTPFNRWMHTPPKESWALMLDSISTTPSLGTQRSDILFGTVFLPALYSLGNLLFDQTLKSTSWQLWKSHRLALPGTLLRLFEQTDLPASLYAHQLGTIYQLRTYCKPHKCQKCKVFKNIISS